MQMPGRTYSSSTYRYGFNGKENDNEVKGTGNQQDYGMRIYDPRVSRFLSVDPLQTKYPDASPYLFSANNPIANIDVEGKYALFIHFMLTRYMLLQAGASEVQANLIAHYASVYADNPGGVNNFSKYKSYSTADIIIIKNIKDSQKDNPIFDKIGGKLPEDKVLKGVTHNTDIDYSRTAKSQSEDAEAQKWHSTRTYAEKNIVTSQEAVNRSLSNAWDMLFKSASESGIDNMQKNTDALQNFGLALHSFEDIEAHRGAVFRGIWSNGGGLFNWWGNEHNMKNDVNPDAARFGIPQFFVGNAILVHQVMSGNFKRLVDGTQISTQGMSADQIGQLKTKINGAGFEFNSNGNNTYMYSVTKKKS
ncbi:hypothetical protein I5907_12485 [Panacibacter sp. DH6]|uniref:RHS repeat-associated core domain-containing protein n=1 Tax=Panacibacter microcysteis TaxID=2793269 RepID=A0A931GX00_9BACT|nr:RHS repeat-associated core domain-containing protein [Panacibacter microcysteis]MBG9377053.1 hypothetical protein [Panacibacter microcysteis]